MTRPSISFRRYGLAVLIILGAILLHRLVIPGLGPYPYVLVYPAVMFIALLLGLWPGVLAAVVGVLTAEIWLVAPAAGAGTSWGDASRAAIVIFTAFFVGEVGRHLRRAQGRAQADAANALGLQARLKRTLDSITDGYYAVDHEWRFVAVNQRAEEHFGGTAAELLGRNVWELTGAPEDDPVRRNFAEAVLLGRPREFEAHSRVRPQVWGHMHLYPREGLLEIYFSDISARKQAEHHADFLGRLQAEMLQARDPGELVERALRSLGERLAADLVCFGEMTADAARQTICHEYRNEHPSVLGAHVMTDFLSPEARAALIGGETFVVADVAADTRTATRAEGLLTFGVGAFIEQPMVTGRGLEGLLTIISASARAWRPDEVQLVRDATVRLFPALERAWAEAALRESEQRLRVAMDAAGLVPWEIDLGSATVVDSPRLRELFGLAPELPMISRDDWRARLHPDDREMMRRSVEATAAGKATHKVEFRVCLPDGEVRWVAAEGLLSAAPGGGRRLIGVATEITGRKLAEQALRQTGERYALLSDTAGKLLASAHPQALVETLCATVMRHLGCDVFFNFLVDEPSGRLRLNACAGIPLAELHRHQWLDGDGTVCGCVARDRRRYVVEDVAHTSDERAALIRSYGVQAYCCHPLLAGDRVLGTLSFGARNRPRFALDEIELMRAIADQVAVAMERLGAEEALRRQARQLEEQARSLDERVRQRTAQLQELTSELTQTEQRERTRLAQVLHDGLQQLLVAARMQGEMLARTSDPENRRKRGQDLAELLAAAIATSRSLTVELNPPALLEQGLGPGLCWLADWMAQKHRFTVDLDLGTGPEPAEATARLLLFQCVRELLLNAVKHAGTDRAAVRIENDGDGRLHLEVADDGRGFDVTELQARAQEGFGLSSIRQRLELLGGSFDVRSAPGRGTSIRLSVPLRGAAPARRDVPERVSTRSVPLPVPAPDGPVRFRFRQPDRPIRIVLADDHEIVREGLAGLLREQADMEIVGEAPDGLAAVELAGTLLPDIVIMDISMPRLDGIEATRRIAAAHPEVRVIGLSTYEQADKETAIRSAGALAYLSKDAPAEKLLAAIRRAVRAAAATG